MAACLVVAALLVPVPWMHVVSDDPLGTAWRLDGRLQVDGVLIDPPGRWSWLAVGRPQLVGEVVWDRLVGRENAQVDDLRTGPIGARPALNEPAAVAIGLRHAGHDVPLGVLVEVRRPLLDGLPDRGVLTSVDGIPVTDRETWEELSRRWTRSAGAWPVPHRSGGAPGTVPATSPGRLELTFRGGQEVTAPGPGLPYSDVHVVPTAPPDLDAGISFEVVRHLPVEGLRSLSLGGSHGLMVALLTYAHASGDDLAQGRHIAGTGGILGDGTVTPIGGLPAKARAAHRAGADVLLVPRDQRRQLETIDLTGTQVVPVDDLAGAIAWLANPVT